MKNGDNLIHSFNHTPTTEGNFNNLTKREYFAGLAMEGLISKSASQMQINTENLIHKSLELADELLKQLEK